MATILCDNDENDCGDFAHQRAINEYLDEVDVSPTSLLNNRGPGLRLLNTKLSSYDDSEQNMYRSPNNSKESSASEFYLKCCTSSHRDSVSPLYTSSSASASASATASSSSEDSHSDESEFLKEARASLREIDTLDSPREDEQDDSSTSGSSTSTCSGYDEISDRVLRPQSAFSFDEYRGSLGKNRHSLKEDNHSCPDIYPRKRTVQPESTKSLLQKIKDEESLQRQRIAGAIAATNPKTPSSSGLRRRGSPSNMFFRKKENQVNHPASERKVGRTKLMKSIRQSWRTPTSASTNRLQRGLEERDDENNSTPRTTPVLTQKELQLKRAFLGSARVLTMDGIVESFASDPDAAAALASSPNGKHMVFTPTTGAPLTWV